MDATPPRSSDRSIDHPSWRGKIEQFAPTLAADTEQRLLGEVWSRPGLSRRDRSLITLSALIVRGQAQALAFHAGQAIVDGVTPQEIGEILNHLAYYAGWGSAIAAVGPIGEAFAAHEIAGSFASSGTAQPLPLDEAVEAKRAKAVADQFAATAPGLVELTTNYLFRDLWLRPGLAPRDRSLVTVAALLAAGQVAQITFHLNRAMDNGLTRAEGAEAVTHLAFYAGWPNAMSALPVFKDVFAAREPEE